MLLLAAPAFASTTSPEIVYTVDADNDGVYALALQDLETHRVTTLLPADTTQGYIYDDPELSPDGSRIVLSTDYPGTPGAAALAVPGLAIINRDGTGFRRLTTPPTSDTSASVDTFPAWSPGAGATIVFTRTTSTDSNPDDTVPPQITTALFTVASGGGTPAAVPNTTNGYSADFNPLDANQIVYTELTDVMSGVGPLTVIQLDGNGKRALGASGAPATGALPAWSPDGTTIAYAAVTSDDTSSADADVAQIATVGVTAGSAPKVFTQTRPSSTRTVAEYPAWSPDGESILYDFYAYDASGNELAGDLWAVDRNDVRAGKVFGGAGDEAQAHEQGPAPTAATSGTPSRFTPVNPKRILDTREGIGAPRAKVQANSPLVLQVRGVQTDSGPVPDTATAVILNVTVTNTTALTDIRVYPSDTTPTASNLNANRGQTVPNLVTATLSANGTVSLRSAGGTVDLIADLAGWYTPTTGASGFTSLDPARILDTRSSSTVGVPAAGKVAGGSPIDLQVTGTLPTAGGGTVSVPSDATAVVLNVTGTSPSQATNVRVFPTPVGSEAPPTVSNLNLNRGETAPNLVTVAVGAGGKVRLANAAGTVDLIADISGYYSAGSAGRYVPMTPLRFLDTRSGIGAAPTAIPANGYDDLKIAGTRGVPANALAAVLNLTATSVTNLSDVRAYPKPTDARQPTVSNLNPTRGATRANLAIVKPGDDGRVRLLVKGATLHLIGDVSGYFI
jgi:Tol biopolymer transport system component